MLHHTHHAWAAGLALALTTVGCGTSTAQQDEQTETHDELHEHQTPAAVMDGGTDGGTTTPSTCVGPPLTRAQALARFAPGAEETSDVGTWEIVQPEQRRCNTVTGCTEWEAAATPEPFTLQCREGNPPKLATRVPMSSHGAVRFGLKLGNLSVPDVTIRLTGEGSWESPGAPPRDDIHAKVALECRVENPSVACVYRANLESRAFVSCFDSLWTYGVNDGSGPSPLDWKAVGATARNPLVSSVFTEHCAEIPFLHGWKDPTPGRMSWTEMRATLRATY